MRTLQEKATVETHHVRNLNELAPRGRPQPAWAQLRPNGAVRPSWSARMPPHHPHRTTNRDTHGIVTGELDAGKLARPVRAGGRRKRTPPRKPRRRPTGTPLGAWCANTGESLAMLLRPGDAGSTPSPTTSGPRVRRSRDYRRYRRDRRASRRCRRHPRPPQTPGADEPAVAHGALHRRLDHRRDRRDRDRRLPAPPGPTAPAGRGTARDPIDPGR